MRATGAQSCTYLHIMYLGTVRSAPGNLNAYVFVYLQHMFSTHDLCPIFPYLLSFFRTRCDSVLVNHANKIEGFSFGGACAHLVSHQIETGQHATFEWNKWLHVVLREEYSEAPEISPTVGSRSLLVIQQRTYFRPWEPFFQLFTSHLVVFPFIYLWLVRNI